MHLTEIIIWGFAGTLLLTTLMAASRPLGWSRMDLPFLLGTMVTANRDKAPFYGFLMHLCIGWIFAALYMVTFISAGIFTWWFGLIVGGLHGAFVLTAGIQLIASFHPRMAQPYRGPTPTRMLEPPGIFARNYGWGTPLITILAHLVFGLVLGIFYHP